MEQGDRDNLIVRLKVAATIAEGKDGLRVGLRNVPALREVALMKANGTEAYPAPTDPKFKALMAARMKKYRYERDAENIEERIGEGIGGRQSTHYGTTD